MKILCPAIIAFSGSARPHNYGTKPKFFEEASQIIIVPLTRPIQNVWQVQRGFGHENETIHVAKSPKFANYSKFGISLDWHIFTLSGPTT